MNTKMLMTPVTLIGRRESSAELGERSDKLQRGARMPGQRQAGQLVLYISGIIR